MPVSILDREFRNNATVGITAGISNVATSVTVDNGAAINLTSGKHMIATLSEGALVEIVLITAQAGATLTIERAQEGTTAQTFTTAALLEVRPTAGTMQAILDYLISLLPPAPAYPVWGDVTLMAYDSVSIDVSATIGTGWGLKMSSDGLHMYITKGNLTLVQRFSLSTAWDITTAVAAETFSDGAYQIRGFCLSQDGTKAYVASYSGGDTVRQYALSTPWVLSSAVYVASSPDLSWPILNYTQDIAISLDGTKIILADESDKKLKAFSLSTPFDITTMGAVVVSEIFPNHASYLWLVANEDFSKLLWTAQNPFPSNGIEQYTVSTPGNLSTAVMVNRQPTVAPIGFHHGLAIGLTKLYFLSSGVVYQYSW